MHKELLPLEERVKKLENEVERLRKLLESHIKDHDPYPIHPTKPPSRPFDPKHPDVGPPREF